MQFNRQVAVAATVSLLVVSGPVRADEVSDEIKALRQQIEALSQKVQSLEQRRASEQETLDQKVKVIERQRELQQEAAAEKAKTVPEISIGATGFSVRSANSNFMVGLHAHLQLDSRTFFKDGGIKGNDGFLLRRARPILEGTVFRDFDFCFMPDFGTGANGNTTAPTPQIFDAYLNYRNRPELQFRVGKFKPPIGLEALQADVDVILNERSLATELVPTRDLGAQVFGQLFDGRASYAVGIFNGVGDYRNSGNSDFEDDKDLAARIFLQPLKQSSLTALQGFGFGVGGSYGSMSTATALPSTTGGTLPGYATDGQEQFFAYNPAAVGGATPVVVADGTHWRLSPQGYYYCGPFGFMGEYVISDQRVRRTVVAPLTAGRLETTAWEITGSWVLTGEDASYKGVNPARPFHPASGQWGALQLVARYAQLDLDTAAFPLFSDPNTSARSAIAWSVGLNWILNKNVLVKASFSRTTFDGGGGAGTTAPAIVTRQPENVFFTRVQLGF